MKNTSKQRADSLRKKDEKEAANFCHSHLIGSPCCRYCCVRGDIGGSATPSWVASPGAFTLRLPRPLCPVVIPGPSFTYGELMSLCSVDACWVAAATAAGGASAARPWPAKTRNGRPQLFQCLIFGMHITGRHPVNGPEQQATTTLNQALRLIYGCLMSCGPSGCNKGIDLLPNLRKHTAKIA